MAQPSKGRSGRPRKARRRSSVQRRNAASHENERGSLETVIVSFARRGQLKEAANNAVDSQRAAGLPIVYQSGNRIVREHPDGTQETLRIVLNADVDVPDRFQSLIVGKRRTKR